MVWCCYPEQPAAKGGCRLYGGCTEVQPYKMACLIPNILEVL